MKTTQIDITFDNKTLSPILTFIEETKKGEFTDGSPIVVYQKNNLEIEPIYPDYDGQCLIYGVSY